MRDRKLHRTERVSVSSGGKRATKGGGSPDVWGGYARVSATGRFVVFQSMASNLVAGDTNRHTDVFVHDRATGQTTRVSVSSHGVQANDGSGEATISPDGRFVTFASMASNLVVGDTNQSSDVFVRDRATGQTTRVSVNSHRGQGNVDSLDPAISANGRFVAFASGASNLVAGDTNGKEDVFLRDRATGTTTLVSVGQP